MTKSCPLTAESVKKLSTIAGEITIVDNEDENCTLEKVAATTAMSCNSLREIMMDSLMKTESTLLLDLSASTTTDEDGSSSTSNNTSRRHSMSNSVSDDHNTNCNILFEDTELSVSDISIASIPPEEEEEEHEVLASINTPQQTVCEVEDDDRGIVKSDIKQSSNKCERSFLILRYTYLLVTLVIMLADGLQGTHLYVLYEGYGFSVASLYCLGFATGGIMSPITGPLVDKIGRKKSAILYCILEIFINMLEQYPFLIGLIISRMIGGFTTNLLSSVFETWLDTEYRKRGFPKEKYEIIMRDSVIVSNSAAIFSGYLAHILAERYGAIGPFQGAVSCTAIALIVVCFVWTENYGTSIDNDNTTRNMLSYFNEAVAAFRTDNKMLRVGIIQGLSAGSVQIFVFLWAPTLRHFAKNNSASNEHYSSWALDKAGEPAYGLIFGAYMCAGVLGGLVAPRLRRSVSDLLSPIVNGNAPIATVDIEGEGEVAVRPMAVEFLASTCYLISAIMLFVPCICSDDGPNSFSNALTALLAYEFLIGVFLPCEGVIRSLYFPTDARCSIMTLPRIIVNVAVAVGVVSTNYISLRAAFSAVGCLMVISTALQLSLISQREWSSLFTRVDMVQGKVAKKARSLSLSMKDMLVKNAAETKPSRRRHTTIMTESTISTLIDKSFLFDDISEVIDLDGYDNNKSEKPKLD